jgi:hypothetical protein
VQVFEYIVFVDGHALATLPKETVTQLGTHSQKYRFFLKKHDT